MPNSQGYEDNTVAAVDITATAEAPIAEPETVPQDPAAQDGMSIDPPAAAPALDPLTVAIPSGPDRPTSRDLLLRLRDLIDATLTTLED